MRKLVAGLMLVVAASVSQAQESASSAPRQLPQGKKFSVLLEHSGTTWTATCELGCTWTGNTLSFSCPKSCIAIIDANGLVTSRTPRDPNAAFSFVLSADDEGFISAKPKTGTLWQGLGWACAKKDPCAVRVNEFGVSVAGVALNRAPGT